MDNTFLTEDLVFRLVFIFAGALLLFTIAIALIPFKSERAENLATRLLIALFVVWAIASAFLFISWWLGGD